MPITQIAFAAGFKSVRRFNEAMRQTLKLSPREIRKSDKPSQSKIELKLYYRPPFAWDHCFDFLSNRVIPNLECCDQHRYSRTIRYGDSVGTFTIKNDHKHHCLLLSVELDDYTYLNAVTQRVKLLFDVDAPIEKIDQQLRLSLPTDFQYLLGLRIPGIWTNFEAGIRAILGQQVSVAQARNLVTSFVDNLGDDLVSADQVKRKLFPEPRQVCDSSLDFFRMPQARKDTLRRLAEYFATGQASNNIDDWLSIKGIGPWSVNYVKIRAVKEPDVWLAGDAGIKNALKKIDHEIDLEKTKPWRSYLTFQLWNQLN